ncbi:MAG: DNA-binding protein [Erysipelotrichaceae bacterium]|nr:DNA-binding protein [Erysipelotrichaceae bacterium]
MEKLLTRKEAARLLGISIATLDQARANGLVSFVQYCENGSVYFTELSLQEYVARSTHKAKPKEINTGTTFRSPRSAVRR